MCECASDCVLSVTVSARCWAGDLSRVLPTFRLQQMKCGVGNEIYNLLLIEGFVCGHSDADLKGCEQNSGDSGMLASKEKHTHTLTRDLLLKTLSTSKHLYQCM